MRAAKPIRYAGRITTWKDEQGFGFITPNGGGAAVFVHISAFGGTGARPACDDIVTYHLGTNEKGQPRAHGVAFAAAGNASSRPRQASAPQRSGLALLLAGGWFGVLAIAVAAGTLPGFVPCIYALMSLIAYAAYAADKTAAQNGAWRTPENTLHLLGLACGWPGALLAQQRYRHKTTKQSFQIGFWCTVLLNGAALGYLLSAPGVFQ